MGRPPLRAEPDAARDTVRGPRRRRQTDDKFAIPPELKTPGVSYEWKKESVLGEEDPQYLSGLLENGWEHVQLSEMPVFGRPGESGAIRRGGQVLMKRPTELTHEARLEDYQIARAQVTGNAKKMMGSDFDAGVPNKGSHVNVKYDTLPSDAKVFKTATTQLTLED